MQLLRIGIHNGSVADQDKPLHVPYVAWASHLLDESGFTSSAISVAPSSKSAFPFPPR